METYLVLANVMKTEDSHGTDTIDLIAVARNRGVKDKMSDNMKTAVKNLPFHHSMY